MQLQGCDNHFIRKTDQYDLIIWLKLISEGTKSIKTGSFAVKPGVPYTLSLDLQVRMMTVGVSASKMMYHSILLQYCCDSNYSKFKSTYIWSSKLMEKKVKFTYCL